MAQLIAELKEAVAKLVAKVKELESNPVPTESGSEEKDLQSILDEANSVVATPAPASVAEQSSPMAEPIPPAESEHIPS